MPGLATVLRGRMSVLNNYADEPFKALLGVVFDETDINKFTAVSRFINPMVIEKYLGASSLEYYMMPPYYFTRNGLFNMVTTVFRDTVPGSSLGSEPQMDVPQRAAYVVRWQDITILCMDWYGEHNVMFPDCQIFISLKENEGKVRHFIRDVCANARLYDVFKKQCVRFYRARNDSLRREVIEREILSFDKIYLMESQRHSIQRYIIDFMDNIDTYKKYDIKQNRGVLLYGPPGNGKTTLGKALMSQLKDVTFFWITSEACAYSSDVSKIYNFARETSPSVLFFEDVGPYIKSRGQTSELSVHEESLLNAFLQEMDGPFDNSGIMTIMTTNMKVTDIDAAILRPGRIGYSIEFTMPAPDDRAIYLHGLLKPHGVSEPEVVKEIASYELSYAQLNEVINIAKCILVDKKLLNDDGSLTLNNEVLKEAATFVHSVGIKDTELGFRRRVNESAVFPRYDFDFMDDD